MSHSDKERAMVTKSIKIRLGFEDKKDRDALESKTKLNIGIKNSKEKKKFFDKNQLEEQNKKLKSYMKGLMKKISDNKLNTYSELCKGISPSRIKFSTSTDVNQTKVEKRKINLLNENNFNSSLSLNSSHMEANSSSNVFIKNDSNNLLNNLDNEISKDDKINLTNNLFTFKSEGIKNCNSNENKSDSDSEYKIKLVTQDNYVNRRNKALTLKNSKHIIKEDQINKLPKKVYSSVNIASKNLNNYFDKDEGKVNETIRLSNSEGSIIEKEKFQNKGKIQKRTLRKMNAVLSDSLSEEEEIYLSADDHESNFLIFPDSQFKLFWSSIIILLTFYSILYTPIDIAFSNKKGLYLIIFNLVVDLIFISDLIVNFFVPFQNFEENLVKSYKRIAINYLSSWFIWDLLACLPASSMIDLFFYFNNSANVDAKIYTITHTVRFAKFQRLLKLSQFFKVSKITKKTEKNKLKPVNLLQGFNVTSSINRFMKFIISFLIITHILSCFWIYLGTIWNPNWIFTIGAQNYAETDLYVCSVYFIWSTIFTIGYGDIYPINSLERVFVILLMFIGILLYSFAVSSLGSILTKSDKMTVKYLDSLQLLNEIKKKHNVPAKFYDKVVKFINYNYRFNKIEKFDFLNELPLGLKHAMLTKMYEELLKNFKFFKFENEEFKSKVLVCLRPVRAFKNEYICLENENLEEFFLVRRGKLSINLGIKYNHAKIMEIRRSEHFGDTLIMAQQKSPINIKVTSKICDLFYINKSDLIQISIEFAEIWEKLFLISTYNYLIMLELMENKIKKIESEEKKMNFYLNRENRKINSTTKLDEIEVTNTFENHINNQNNKVLESFIGCNLKQIKKALKELPILYEKRHSLSSNTNFVTSVSEQIRKLSKRENKDDLLIFKIGKGRSSKKYNTNNVKSNEDNMIKKDVRNYKSEKHLPVRRMNSKFYKLFSEFKKVSRLKNKKTKKVKLERSTTFNKLIKEHSLNTKTQINDKSDTFKIIDTLSEDTSTLLKTKNVQGRHYLSTILVSNIGQKIRNFFDNQKDPEKFLKNELKHVLKRYFEKEYYEQFTRIGELISICYNLRTHNLESSYNLLMSELKEKDFN